MQKAQRKIAFLAAEPSDQAQLRMQLEAREIREGLQLARLRDSFDFTIVPAVRTRDLQQALLSERPHVVHFSGHGTEDGELLVEGVTGRAQVIDPEALAELFGLCKQHVDCVLLNACYSERQARAIAAHIPYVVGTRNALADRAGIAFSIGFYRALGEGKPYPDAFAWGRAQFRLDFPRCEPPVLLSDPRGIHAKTSAATIVQMTREQLSQLAREYKAQLAAGSNEAETHLSLGAIYLQLHLYDLAIQHLRRVIDHDPACADGYYLLALAGLRGRPLSLLSPQEAKAIESYIGAALQIDEKRAQYYLFLALIKQGYYAANGLRIAPPTFSELIASARSRIADPGEVDRLLGALPHLDPYLKGAVDGAF